jgi:hypothetical protein
VDGVCGDRGSVALRAEVLGGVLGPALTLVRDSGPGVLVRGQSRSRTESGLSSSHHRTAAGPPGSSEMISMDRMPDAPDRRSASAALSARTTAYT